MSASGGTKAVLAALTANAFIALTKFAAWALTASSSMLAEAIHSCADTANQFLLLAGSRAAKREATEEHPFGFGSARFVNAFLVSVILFSLGGLFALYEAYEKWHEVNAGHPNEMLEGPWWWVPLVVLLAAIAAEGFSFRTAIRESIVTKGRQSWAQYVRRAKAPELPVILLEDFAALLGLLFALFGVGMTLLTHNGYWDVVGTAMIGALLIVVAIVLAYEMNSLLIGEAASPESIAAIKSALGGSSGVTKVIHMRTLHLGPEEVLVAAKIEIEPTASVQRVVEVINTAEAAVREAAPSVALVYLEPDVYHPDEDEHAPGMLGYTEEEGL